MDNGHLLWGPGISARKGKHHTMPAFIRCCKASCPRNLGHRNNEALPLLHLLLESPEAIDIANWISCTTIERNLGRVTQHHKIQQPLLVALDDIAISELDLNMNMTWKQHVMAENIESRQKKIIEHV